MSHKRDSDTTRATNVQFVNYPVKSLKTCINFIKLSHKLCKVLTFYETIITTIFSGLDPALPFFTTVDRHSKLDKSDAKFVDVIHTNAGVFGKIEPSGHVDFYINGGQTQPACEQHKSIFMNNIHYSRIGCYVVTKTKFIS